MKRQIFALSLCLLLALGAAEAQKKKSRATSPTVPAGAAVHVRIIENLTSETAQPGDPFTGTLAEPIVNSAGTTLYPKGADVTGRVISAKKSGRLTDPGILELELTRVTSGTYSTKLTTEPFVIKGESHTKSNVTKIGGGAAAGAVIGAIAGGGKGAAIGAAVGAAAGTGVAAATGKKEAKVESEAVLSFTTVGASTATAAEPAASKGAETAAKEYNDSVPAEARSFSARDRRVVRNCFQEHASSLPPGLAKREQLPPGLQRQLERNGTLPPGLQKKVQPLPEVCESQLARLPGDLERVIYNRRIMLLDGKGTILDAFDLDAE